MSESIKAGDLVVVLRGNGCRRCDTGNQPSVGKIFQVQKIASFATGSYCTSCNAKLTTTTYVAARAENGGHYGLDRLKRIPPLEELDDVKREEELYA